MNPLRAARHALIRAAIAEYREARELSATGGYRNAKGVWWWSDAAWSALTRAAALAEQARAVGEAMRVLQTLVDNPVRLEPCLPPQCVWCERQQPRYNGAHTPDCALARLVSPG